MKEKREEIEEMEDQGEDLITQASEDVISPHLIASVNGQVKDTSGNSWGYAVLQFSLFVPSGQKPIELSTGLVIPNPAPVVCDAAGNFTTALQKTDSVVPDCLWKLTILDRKSVV